MSLHACTFRHLKHKHQTIRFVLQLLWKNIIFDLSNWAVVAIPSRVVTRLRSSEVGREGKAFLL